MVTVSNEARINALAVYLGIEVDEEGNYPIEEGNADNTFEAERAEYLVLTDEEADEQAKSQILESVWAFNLDFLMSHFRDKMTENLSGSRYDALMRSLRRTQEELSEDANGLFLALIEDEDRFVRDALSGDGRGHFITSYDGEEQECYLDGPSWDHIRELLLDLPAHSMVTAALEACERQDTTAILVFADWLDEQPGQDSRRLRDHLRGCWFFIYRMG